MTKNKISSMLVFTVVVFLALAIVSGLYFFNIKKNEDYQNQLHFRELNSVANEVTSGYTQFVKISTVLLNIRNSNQVNQSEAVCDESSKEGCGDKILNLQTGSYESSDGANRSEMVSVTNRARESRALRNIITTKKDVQTLFENPDKLSTNALVNSPQNQGARVISFTNDETVFVKPPILSECNSDKPNCSFSVNVTQIPTSDLIPEQVLSFPFIVLADKYGKVKARKFFYENSTDTADLEFTSVKKILTALYNQQKEEGVKDEVLPSYSGTIDRVIGGIQYRIFIQPANIGSAAGGQDTHFLLGFVALNEFRLTNLSVNPNAGLWIMIVLIGLTAIIPILKLRFTATQEHFTRSDINLFFTGCFLLLGLISITITHQFFYDYLKNSTLAQSQNLFSHIQQDFKNEIEKVASLQSESVFTNTIDPDNRQSCKYLQVNANESRGFSSGATVTSENCVNENLRYSLDLAMYGNKQVNAFAESAFRINSAGLIPTRQAFPTEREAIQRIGHETFNFTDFSLSHREYFQRAINCDLWSAQPKFLSECNAQGNLFIQRIKNVSDGRLSTQFSFADFKDANYVMPFHHNVKSISIKLRTFFDRVLPKNFGYAVFDKDGQVLFHSNQDRSLAENILVETNNNRSIDLLMNSLTNTNDTVVFNATYRNAKHSFVGGSIHDVVPWKLVVFYDLKDLESTSLWTFLLAIYLFVQVLLILFLWSRYGTNQDSWTRLISFCPERQRSYSNCGMFMFAGIFLCLGSMGVVVDLSARLALWLGLLAYYIFVFNHAFGEKPKRAHVWTHPMLPFAALSLLFGIYFASEMSLQSFTFDNAVSLGFAIFGLIFFVIARIGFGQPQLFASFNQRVRNTLFSSHHSSFRYTYRYVFYLSVFIWFFAMVPGVLIINAANQYLLKVQAFHQSSHIEKQEKVHLAALHDYFTLVGADSSGYKIVDNLKGIDLPSARCVLLSCNRLAWIDFKEDKQEDSNLFIKTDLHVDPLFNRLIRTQSFGGSLSEDLYQFAQLEQKPSYIQYNTNSFFLHALQNKVILVSGLLILLFTLTLLFVRRAIVHGIMGEHLPDNPNADTAGVPFTSFLQKHLTKQGARLQIIQPDQPEIMSYLAMQQDLQVLGSRAFDIANISLMRESETKLDIISWLIGIEDDSPVLSDVNAENKGEHRVLVLNNFEKLVSNKQLRNNARSFIKELHDKKEISVILLCDVDVLIQFNDCMDINDEDALYTLPADESLAWSLFLRRYINFVMCYTQPKVRLENDPSAYQTFVYETQGWPELAQKGKVLTATLLGADADKMTPQEIQESLDNTWKPDQIVQCFSDQCTAYYRYKWSLCTIAERLLLFQLAQDSVVNPANARTLHSLVKRGYVYRDSGWFVVNESFKRFILTAESQARFQSWLQASKNHTWKLIRIPIFVTILVLLALIVVATGQSIQSILATATAALGLVSLLMRNLTSFKGAMPSNQSE
jgi:hypothetical protein